MLLPAEQTAAASLSSESSDDGSGGREDGRAPAEAGPGGAQLGGRGQERGLPPHDESSLSYGGLGSRTFSRHPKTVVPVSLRYSLSKRESIQSYTVLKASSIQIRTWKWGPMTKAESR